MPVVKRYLVVDDSRAVRVTLADSLRRVDSECKVEEAPDASSAVKMYFDAPHDVVFLDLVLPDGKGADVLERILEHEPRARIVVVTGLGPEDPEVVRCLSAGAFAFLRKPVRTEDIRTVLDKVAREDSNAGRIR